MGEPAEAATYKGPERLRSDTHLIREAVFTCDFEGSLSWSLALDAERPFTVTSLRDPARLVVEIH